MANNLQSPPDAAAPAAAPERQSASRMPFLPRRRIGWWAFGVLVATALYPLWWGGLENLIANDTALVATAAVIGLMAFGLGAFAILAGKDRSILLITILAATLAEVLLGLMVVVVLFGQPGEPKFESLADHPDKSLRGTVAYLSDESGCVRIRAASGQPAKTVFCPPGEPVATAEKEGKLLGPQLRWLPDGRLEVTMFRMTTPPGPTYNPGWQKIVDVVTGAVEDVPAAAVPAQPDPATGPTVNPSGQRITWTSESGRVKVMLTDNATTRTLLSVQGPPPDYSLETAYWAPNWQWIAASDRRILIITVGDPSVTRVLTDESGRGAAFNFAVTGTDILG